MLSHRHHLREHGGDGKNCHEIVTYFFLVLNEQTKKKLLIEK